MVVVGGTGEGGLTVRGRTIAKGGNVRSGGSLKLGLLLYNSSISP